MPSATDLPPKVSNIVSPSFLKKTDFHDVHDMVCVGFGPASLAIAVALHDMIKDGASFEPKVRFLEQQSQFGWHAGMLLPGAKMQISFIKDLATLRDPCSKFTFLNYLKVHNRLAHFANLDTFLPMRVEFEDYLRWVARHFEDVVDYSHEVLRVNPIKRNTAERFDCFEVVSRDSRTGQETKLVTRNVVIAIGGRPARPNNFPKELERSIHSSQYSYQIAKLLPNKEKSYNVAIIGSGQSAAEIFSDLHSRYPKTKTQMIFRDTSLRPSDDSPFVNEIFNPEMVDQFYHQSVDVRADSIRRNKATNYSVVRLGLLEKIYEELYSQSIHEPDKDRWQHRILTSREIMDVTPLPQNKQINLTLKGFGPGPARGKEILTVDAVILATGYVRNTHIDMLQNCHIINGSSDGQWITGRDYQVKLDHNFTERNIGIWLQGCNEVTHGLSDSLLSILATRSGELVKSIFGSPK